MKAVETAPQSSRADAALRPEPEITVYFDGSCPLCSAEIAHYAGQRGGERMAFADASDERTVLGAGLGRDDAMNRFHVRLANGRVLSGAQAFAAVWEALPRWRWAARMARLPGAMAGLEAAYRAFLPLRPWLSALARRLGARPFRAERSGPFDG